LAAVRAVDTSGKSGAHR